MQKLDTNSIRIVSTPCPIEPSRQVRRAPYWRHFALLSSGIVQKYRNWNEGRPVNDEGRRWWWAPNRGGVGKRGRNKTEKGENDRGSEQRAGRRQTPNVNTAARSRVRSHTYIHTYIQMGTWVCIYMHMCMHMWTHPGVKGSQMRSTSATTGVCEGCRTIDDGTCIQKRLMAKRKG